jgi:hypothetical protein
LRAWRASAPDARHWSDRCSWAASLAALKELEAELARQRALQEKATENREAKQAAARAAAFNALVHNDEEQIKKAK